MTMYTLKATLEEADAIAKGDKQFIFRADSMPCEDAIATIGVMYERCDTYDITDYRDLMLEAVKVLPSADRPQEWIPCSERLPSEKERKEWIDNNLSRGKEQTMSKDIIYREDAIKAIDLRVRIPHDVVSAQYASMAKNAIYSVPSADRPQGHYIKGENGERYCSNCKRIDDKYSVARFCWWCGAKMKGADDDMH